MQLNDLTGQSQSDSQASAGDIPMLWNLTEQLKEAVDAVVWNTVAFVPDPYDGLPTLLLAYHVDGAARCHVLGRIVQEIGEHLRQPLEVTIHPHMLIGLLDHKVVSPLRHQRPFARPPPESELSGRAARVAARCTPADARNVEQIVHQPHEV